MSSNLYDEWAEHTSENDTSVVGILDANGDQVGTVVFHRHIPAERVSRRVYREDTAISRGGDFSEGLRVCPNCKHSF